MAIRRRSSSPVRAGWRQGRSASGSCRSPTDPDAACLRCTTRVENAHGTGVREVLYRWHPWFGRDVHVHAAITKSDGVYFRCTLNGTDGARWQELVECSSAMTSTLKVLIYYSPLNAGTLLANLPDWLKAAPM